MYPIVGDDFKNQKIPKQVRDDKEKEMSTKLVIRLAAGVVVLFLIGALGIAVSCADLQRIPVQGTVLEENVRVFSPQIAGGRGVIFHNGTNYPTYELGFLTVFQVNGMRFPLFTGTSFNPALLSVSSITIPRWVNNPYGDNIGSKGGNPVFYSPATKTEYMVSPSCGGFKILP